MNTALLSHGVAFCVGPEPRRYRIEAPDEVDLKSPAVRERITEELRTEYQLTIRAFGLTSRDRLGGTRVEVLLDLESSEAQEQLANFLRRPRVTRSSTGHR